MRNALHPHQASLSWPLVVAGMLRRTHPLSGCPKTSFLWVAARMSNTLLCSRHVAMVTWGPVGSGLGSQRDSLRVATPHYKLAIRCLCCAGWSLVGQVQTGMVGQVQVRQAGDRWMSRSRWTRYQESQASRIRVWVQVPLDLLQRTLLIFPLFLS